MATLMDVRSIEREAGSRRPFFSAIRWGAVFAGVVSGTASYLLLALLGLAVGLTAVDPAAQEPVGAVPLGAGIWTGVSMLVAAFIGGYVAGHMSGLARSMDGMLHGFVSWGATTLLYAILATTAIGSLLGGTLGIIGQGMQAMTGQAAGGQGALGQVQSIISQQGGQVDAQSLQALQQALSAGDRQGAINVMVNQMGFEQQTAAQVVERIAPLMSSQNLQQTATQATEALTAASWWLFIGLLLSLALGIAGGATGVRANANRLSGDHVAERQSVA